jgi:hypothetical protein
MSAGPNLSKEELQQLHDLLVAFEGSQEIEETGTPEEHEALQSAITVVNFARVSKPEEEG